jgi:hypothetical protein
LSRNVSSIIAGVTAPIGDADIDEWNASSGFDITPSSAGAKLLPDLIGGVPKVYYFTGDVTIDTGGADLGWTGERTLIVQGGNVYINSNLYNSAVGLSKPKLGIIVLKDLTDTNVLTQGGNVYVGPLVTNIQANIYTDGSLFSYDPAKGLTPGGLPKFASEADRFNSLKNQLYLEGSLASLNTIGGAVSNPPILGDGTETASSAEGTYGDTPTGRSRARLYDLNFLRYYGLVFERDPGTGDAIDQQGDLPGSPDYLELTYVLDGGDLVKIEGGIPAQGLNQDSDFSAVYINFDPPTASLPGFGVTTGINLEIRP